MILPQQAANTCRKCTRYTVIGVENFISFRAFYRPARHCKRNKLQNPDTDLITVPATTCCNDVYCIASRDGCDQYLPAKTGPDHELTYSRVSQSNQRKHSSSVRKDANAGNLKRKGGGTLQVGNL